MLASVKSSPDNTIQCCFLVLKVSQPERFWNLPFWFLKGDTHTSNPINSPTNQGETTFCLLLMAIGRCLLVLPFLILQNFTVLDCAVSCPASYLILTKSLLTCACVCKHPSPHITGFDDHSTTSRRRQWHPTPVLLPRKSHGWRSLVGCSPWGR